MKTSIKRILAIFCALAMTVTLFAGCRDNPDEYSIISEIIEDGSTQTINDKNSNTDSKETNSDDSSKKANNSQSGKTDQSSKTGQSGTTVNPADYKGTTITYATWDRSEGLDTAAAIAKFKSKYGITVNIKTVSQKNYVQEVTALIQSGNSPDVIKDADFWPGWLSIAQPIDAAKIDLNDTLWDQSFIKQATINGKCYSVASTNLGQNVYLLYYNKKIFSSYGIKTPADYDKIGKWNFDALTAMMTQVSQKAGNGTFGGYIEDYGAYLYACFGKSLFNLKDGKYSTDVNDPLLLDLAKQMATWNKAGLLTDIRENFRDGKAGIAITSDYGLRKTGHWKGMNASDIGYYTIPSFGTTKPITAGSWQGYGICKGAKNPVAGGLWLKYYLNEDNHDIVSNYISEDAYNFRSQLLGDVANKYLQVACSVYYSLGITNRQEDVKSIYNTDPSQMNTIFAAFKNMYAQRVKQLQEYQDSLVK